MTLARVFVSAVLALLMTAGCREAAPPVEERQASYRKVEGIDIWVNRSPRRSFTVVTTEDATRDLDPAGQRDVRMRGNAALMEVAAARAKAIGADAAFMVTKGRGRRELSRMTMFVKYDEPASPASAAEPPTPPGP